MSASRPAQPPPSPPPSDPAREEALRADRHRAYDEARGILSMSARRLTTYDRDIRSIPLFCAWVGLVALGYLAVGWGHWSFIDPVTGRLDAALIAVFLLVCTSATWLCWPLPKKKD